MFYSHFPSNLREMVIEIIGHHTLLNAKEIQSKIHEYYSVNCTHQAIYKVLNILIGENILVKYNYEYTFSIEYIRCTKKKIDVIENNAENLYESLQLKAKLAENSEVKFLCKNTYELITNFEKLFLKLTLHSKRRHSLHRFYYHNVVGVLPDVCETMVDVGRVCDRITTIVYGKTPIDQLSHKYCLGRGEKSALTNVKGKYDKTEYAVLDDYIFTTKYKDEDLFLFDKLVENNSQKNHEQLRKILLDDSNNFEIEVVLKKNKEEARYLRKEIDSYLYM